MQPVPAASTEGLSRSETLFKSFTSIDPHSLFITRSGSEWLLFMKLRALHRWATHNLTNRKYVEITEIYNHALEEENLTKKVTTTEPKHPRALMDCLAETEAKISQRIETKNFKCTYLITSYRNLTQTFSLTLRFVLNSTKREHGVLDQALLCCAAWER